MKKCLFNFLFSANFLLFLSARESLSLSSRVPASELLESGLNSTLPEFEEDVQANVTRRKRNSGGNSPESRCKLKGNFGCQGRLHCVKPAGRSGTNYF